jgi:hypothetical protein
LTAHKWNKERREKEAENPFKNLPDIVFDVTICSLDKCILLDRMSKTVYSCICSLVGNEHEHLQKNPVQGIVFALAR